MLIKKFIIGLLTFYAYDFRSPKQLVPATEVVIERQLETRKKKQAEKKKTKLYDKRKWKKQREYQQQHFKLKGTQSKDVRYSNQQKIRRMFRNS